MFTIEEDLLGLATYLAMGGFGGQPLVTTNWLRHLALSLKENQIGQHIADLAMDNLGPYYEAYCDFVTGDRLLTKEEERWLRDRGFLFGKDPKAPRLVEEFCKLRKEAFAKLKDMK